MEETFSFNSLLLGSTNIEPSGKIMVGTLLKPLLIVVTNSVASSFSSSCILMYSILLASKNAFARRQSPQCWVVYTVILDSMFGWYVFNSNSSFLYV